MFSEERVLRIRYFDVCLDEATSGGTLYIKVKSVTHVEQVLESDPKYPQALPSHCFDLVTIIEVVERRARGRGLIDQVFLLLLSFCLSIQLQNGHYWLFLWCTTQMCLVMLLLATREEWKELMVWIQGKLSWSSKRLVSWQQGRWLVLLDLHFTC